MALPEGLVDDLSILVGENYDSAYTDFIELNYDEVAEFQANIKKVEDFATETDTTLGRIVRVMRWLDNYK
jgi:hypothetical protein